MLAMLLEDIGRENSDGLLAKCYCILICKLIMLCENVIIASMLQYAQHAYSSIFKTISHSL